VPTDQEPARRIVPVPFARVPGWIDRYDERHPDTVWTVAADQVTGDSPDGASAQLPVPFPPLEGEDLAAYRRHLDRRRELGVLLVRRGGFGVAHVVGSRIVVSKLGQRHVQGRTKAGGWSQQRFARRRDNQAKEAYDAAAGHAARLLVPVVARLDALVLGGDMAGVRAVLGDRRLVALERVPEHWVRGVGDPKRSVLEAAVDHACSIDVTVVDPTR
jgi:Actinobacteria/chloroflexi VLRF1 release factor